MVRPAWSVDAPGGTYVVHLARDGHVQGLGDVLAIKLAQLVGVEVDHLRLLAVAKRSANSSDESPGEREREGGTQLERRSLSKPSEGRPRTPKPDCS